MAIWDFWLVKVSAYCVDVMQSSESSTRGRETATGPQQEYMRGLLTYSNASSQQPSSERSIHEPSKAYEGGQSNMSTRVPAKPIHMSFSSTDSPVTGGWDHSASPVSFLPPKLTNQQAPLKPPHVNPVGSQLDQSRRSTETASDQSRHITEAALRPKVLDHQSPDGITDRMTSPEQYAALLFSVFLLFLIHI